MKRIYVPGFHTHDDPPWGGDVSTSVKLISGELDPVTDLLVLYNGSDPETIVAPAVEVNLSGLVTKSVQEAMDYVNGLTGVSEFDYTFATAGTVVPLGSTTLMNQILWVAVNGVPQPRDTYTVSGSNLILSETVEIGTRVYGMKTKLITVSGIDSEGVSEFGGGSIRDYRGKATRADFISFAAGKTPREGFMFFAGGYAYRYKGGTGGVAGATGWIPYGTPTPYHFGAVGDGIADDTAALTALWAYAAAQSNHDIDLDSGTFLYSGTGLVMTGLRWNVVGRGEATRILRNTDGPILVCDGTVNLFQRNRIGNFRLYSTLPTGARPNTHGILMRSNPTTGNGFNSNEFFSISGSGLKTVIRIKETSPALWDDIPQIQKTYGNKFININSDSTYALSSSDQCVVFESGNGGHNWFLGGTWACLGIAFQAGDGIMAVNDMTMTGIHFLGAEGGVWIKGPVDPLRYRKNITITGCQFDGAGSGFTYKLENLSDFTVAGNNTQFGVGPIFINCSAPYIYEDEFRNLNNGVFDTLYDRATPSTHRMRLSNSASGVGITALTGSLSLTSLLGDVSLSGNVVINEPNGVRILNPSALRRNVNDSFLKVAGGNTMAAGASVSLHGGAHATKANRATIAALMHEFLSQDGLSTFATISALGLQAPKGTFTPVFSFSTPGDSVITHSTQIGEYWRFGDLAFVKAHLTFTATHTTAAGVPLITFNSITGPGLSMDSDAEDRGPLTAVNLSQCTFLGGQLQSIWRVNGGNTLRQQFVVSGANIADGAPANWASSGVTKTITINGMVKLV